MKIKINKNLTISDKKPPIVIAEISGNHAEKVLIFKSH